MPYARSSNHVGIVCSVRSEKASNTFCDCSSRWLVLESASVGVGATRATASSSERQEAKESFHGLRHHQRASEWFHFSRTKGQGCLRGRRVVPRRRRAATASLSRSVRLSSARRRPRACRPGIARPWNTSTAWTRRDPPRCGSGRRGQKRKLTSRPYESPGASWMNEAPNSGAGMISARYSSSPTLRPQAVTPQRSLCSVRRALIDARTGRASSSRTRPGRSRSP